MTDPLARAFDAAEAEMWGIYYQLFPPPQCAPAVGVHRGCEHAVQSPVQGGTCTRNSRLGGRCVGDCCATVPVGGWAELVPSTVTPPVDASDARAVAHDRGTCELALWCDDCYDVAHDEMDEREVCDVHADNARPDTRTDPT